jgi:hypothetical protein
MTGANNEVAAADESSKWKYMYGVWVVLAGLLVILVAFIWAVESYAKAADASTALAPVTGVVGTIVGAYFGVAVGAAGKDKADARAAQAEEKATFAAAHLPEGKAQEYLDFLQKLQ